MDSSEFKLGSENIWKYCPHVAMKSNILEDGCQDHNRKYRMLTPLMHFLGEQSNPNYGEMM